MDLWRCFFLPGWFTCSTPIRTGAGGGHVFREQRGQFGNMSEVETLEWWRTYMRSFGDRVGERPAMSGTAAMGACANEWETLAKRLCARCRGYAASAMVLAHTILAELLKAEIEDEVRSLDEKLSRLLLMLFN
jgi:hypothetical protein